MQFNLDMDRDHYAIRAYGPGTITVTLPRNEDEPAHEAMDAIGPDATRVRQEILHYSAVVSPGRLLRDWPPQHFEDLQADHLAMLLDLGPEVVLLGSGADLRWPPAEVIAPLAEAGIGFEVMDTAAACRTYNILMSDGRRVAAALLMI